MAKINNQIKVKEQHVAFEVRQRGFPHGKLAPRKVYDIVREVDLRDGFALHIRVNARLVVRETDEAGRARGVTLNGGVEAVDEFRSVPRAPFHADDSLHDYSEVPPLSISSRRARNSLPSYQFGQSSEFAISKPNS